MHEFFEVGEDPKPSLALRVWAALGAFLLCGFLVLEAIDRFDASSPGFAAKRLWAEATGDRTWLEIEAEALRDFAESETGVGGIGWTRVSIGDRLYEQGAVGRFNPTTMRLTLSEDLLGKDPHEGRWVALHEIAHAASLWTWRTEPYAEALGISGRALEATRGSPVYRKAYEESFADVFAFAMSRRLEATDPKARSEALRAHLPYPVKISIAHDTAPAIREAIRREGEFEGKRGRELMGLIDAIATAGALRQVALWGAEREALCSEGVWGWAKAMRQGAYWLGNPDRLAGWRIESGEPFEAGLRALAAFRDDGIPQRRVWAEAALERAGRAGEPGAEKARASAPYGKSSETALEDHLTSEMFAMALERGEEGRRRGALGQSLGWIGEGLGAAFGAERPRGCL